MVNQGGPSKGCVTCIKRKIRCDRQQPSCSQCRKTQRPCGGYRKMADIMFRDQSNEVKAKFGRASNVQQREDPCAPPSMCSDGSGSVQEPRSRNVAPVVLRSPKLEQDRGLIDFFANNFTCSDSIGMRNNLFWIPQDFDSVLNNDCVILSVQSAGAMALARLTQSPEYVDEAHKRYGTALLSLAAVWRQSTELKRDAFSLAAMFLSFFEIMASYDMSSRLSWRAHLSGLASLYETCDERYLHTDFGGRMFRQTRSQVLVHALQTRTPVPEAFVKGGQDDPHPIAKHFRPFDDADSLLIRLANLQAQLRTSGASTTLISELIALNTACCQWMETLPPHWSFAKQPAQCPAESWWDAREDVYSSGFIAHTWCKVRAARIAAYDLIQESLKRLSTCRAESAIQVRCQPSHELSSDRVRQLATDVCATIPAYYRPFTASVKPSKRAVPPPLGTTFWFLWVLEIVGSMGEAPPELTSWLTRCLEWVSQVTGIDKARLVAERLKAGYRGPVLP